MKTLFRHLNIQLTEKQEGGIPVSLLIVNNPDGTPRWICNANSIKPLFLHFYFVSSFRSRLYAFIIKTIFFLNLQRIVFSTKKVYLKKQDMAMGSLPGFRKNNWALFTGTVGPNNKIVIFEKTENTSYFYKVANSPKAVSLIKNEASVLYKLNTIAPEAFTFPRFGHIEPNILKLEDVSYSGSRNARFSVQHKKALDELYKRTGSIAHKLSTLPIIMETVAKLNEIERVDDTRIPKGIVKKLRILLDSIPDKTKVSVGLSHGDFTPWNMYVEGDKIAMYDWELSKPKMPVGFDAFHFIIQQGILVARKPWNEIKEDIKSNIPLKLFSQWTNNTCDNVDEYLELYLVINTVFYLNVYKQQKKWHRQVYWLVNTWNIAISDCLKEIKPCRELMVLDVFDFLTPKDYAAIKFPNSSPEKLSLYSDIDLCIRKKDHQDIVTFLKQHSLIKKVNRSTKSFMASIQLVLIDDSLLNLDLIWVLKRKHLIMLNAKTVIKNAFRNSFGIKQMNILDMVRYIGLFYGLNTTKIPPKYKAYFQLLEKQEYHLDAILYCNYIDGSTQKTDLVKCLKKKKGNSFLFRTLNLFIYFLDCLKTLLFSKGMMITFSGVDGSGKSTVIENIKVEIEKKIRKPVVVLRHRPSVLPILSAWTKGKIQAEQDATNNLPRQGNSKNVLSSVLRFSYYYTDYLFGQFYVYFKYIRMGYVVLYDRYYFDFINDSKRSNIQLPKSITAAGYTLLCKPCLNFFLYADATTILKRKQELDEDTIDALTETYIKLFRKLDSSSAKEYCSIENIELDKTLDSIMTKVIAKVA